MSDESLIGDFCLHVRKAILAHEIEECSHYSLRCILLYQVPTSRNATKPDHGQEFGQLRCEPVATGSNNVRLRNSHPFSKCARRAVVPPKS